MDLVPIMYQMAIVANFEIRIITNQISRKVLAPPKQGYHISTQWFFERTRGQYTDQLSMHKTPAQKKKFQNQFPTKQKIDKGQFNTVSKIDYATGCCFCIRTKDFKQLKMFNESYPMYGEDVD